MSPRKYSLGPPNVGGGETWGAYATINKVSALFAPLTIPPVPRPPPPGFIFAKTHTSFVSFILSVKLRATLFRAPLSNPEESENPGTTLIARRLSCGRRADVKLSKEFSAAAPSGSHNANLVPARIRAGLILCEICLMSVLPQREQRVRGSQDREAPALQS